MPGGSFVNPLYIIPTSPNGTETQADMSVRLTDILEFFFIAHPASGRREGEEPKRVMYFYPKDETLDRQTEITGFAEAVANFTDNFVNPKAEAEKPEFPHRTVLTQKFEHVYIQVEDCEFLMGVSLSKIQCAAAEYPIFLPAIQNMLIDVYKMFRLFFGRLSPFRKNDQEKFTERLEYFFGRYLPLLRLHRMPLLDYVSGAAFLRLDGDRYLDVVTMSSELLDEFPVIEKLLFLYQDKVLYYILSRRDLPTIFRYLTQSLLPMTIGTELDSQPGPSQGRFLRGPSDINLDTPLVGDDALPTVYLFNSIEDDDTEELVKHHMMVYRSLNATICMFTKEEVTRMLMRNIDAFFATELNAIMSQIGDKVGSQSPDTPSSLDYHYIYFNPASLSLNSSFMESAKISKPPFPPVEVNKLACSSLSSFMSDSEEFSECFTKSELDWWIVLKKANSRFICLLIPPSSSQQSLSDVQARTAAILKAHFEGLFFM